MNGHDMHAYAHTHMHTYRREDRRKEFEGSDLYKDLGIPIHRYTAIDGQNSSAVQERCKNEKLRLRHWNSCLGRLSVEISHVGALREALQRNASAVAVFEDDFLLLPHVKPSTFIESVRATQRLVKKWDVIVLSAGFLNATEINNATVQFAGATVKLRRVYQSRLTDGYVIRRGYIQKLIDAWESCPIVEERRAIDTCWYGLQGRDNWWGYKPTIGLQRSGFSDINRVVKRQAKIMSVMNE